MTAPSSPWNFPSNNTKMTPMPAKIRWHRGLFLKRIYTCKKTLKPYGYRVFLAQKEGFEPSRAFYTPTPLAGEPLRPLGYFCMVENNHNIADLKRLAERVGFEPTDACTSPVFKTGSLNRSDISPNRFQALKKNNTSSAICQWKFSFLPSKKIFDFFEKKACKIQKGVLF